jgi:hypothetical protein
MTRKWLLVKYVPNLNRFEPINVGIVLYCDGEAWCHFQGQTQDGRINGRTVRIVKSLEVYRQWVDHWTRVLKQGGFEALESSAREAPRGENYFLEFGGEIVFDAHPQNPLTLLADLYEHLVVPEKGHHAAAHSAFDMVIKPLQKMLPEKLIRGANVTVSSSGYLDELYFDYRYDGPRRVSLIHQITLQPDDTHSWARIHSASWAFEKLPEATEPALKHAYRIVLFRSAAEERRLENELHQLGSRVDHLVNASNPEAVTELRDLLTER